MNLFNPIFYTAPKPTTRLVAMKTGYSFRSDMIMWCHDAIPELGRAEEIAKKDMAKYRPNVTDYVLINSDEWSKLPEGEPISRFGYISQK